MPFVSEVFSIAAFNESTFSCAAFLRVFITWPNSFFCSLGTFLNSAKKSFNNPFLPKYFMRKFSISSLLVEEKVCTSVICFFIVSIITKFSSEKYFKLSLPSPKNTAQWPPSSKRFVRQLLEAVIVPRRGNAASLLHQHNQTNNIRKAPKHGRWQCASGLAFHLF